MTDTEIKTYIVHAGRDDDDGNVLSGEFLCGMAFDTYQNGVEWDYPHRFLKWAEVSPDDDPNLWRNESLGRAICHRCYNSSALQLALLAETPT